MTMLHAAAFWGDEECIQVLVDAGLCSIWRTTQA